MVGGSAGATGGEVEVGGGSDGEVVTVGGSVGAVGREVEAGGGSDGEVVTVGGSAGEAGREVEAGGGSDGGVVVTVGGSAGEAVNPPPVFASPPTLHTPSAPAATSSLSMSNIRCCSSKRFTTDSRSLTMNFRIPDKKAESPGGLPRG